MKDNQSWLHRLFNSPYFNTWSTISYLSRYSSNGIRYYLVQKLKTHNIEDVYPQLVHIYRSEFSYPIYEFLSEPNLVVYFLVRNDKNEVDKEMLRKARIKSRKYKEVNKISKNSKDMQIQCTYDYNQKVNTENLLFINDQYNTETIYDNTKRDTSYSSCSKFDIPKQLSSERIRNNYRLFPTPVVLDVKSNLTLHGMLLFITKSVTSIMSEDIAYKIDKYQNNFVKKKHTILKTKKNLFSGNLFDSNNWMIPSIKFYDELSNICKRLKLLPKNIRQKGLEIELMMINQNLPGNVMGINMDINIVNVVTDFSYVLDSAENSPFYLIVEVCDYGGKLNRANWMRNVNGAEKTDNDLDNKGTKDKEETIIDIYHCKTDTTLEPVDGLIDENNEILNNEMQKSKCIDNDQSDVKIEETDRQIENMIDEINLNIDACADESSSSDVDVELDSNRQTSGKEKQTETMHIGQSKSLSSENLQTPLPCINNDKGNIIANERIIDVNVYKNAAILLHQLYEINDCYSMNSTELCTIKERIISQIQNIKVEYNINELSWNEKKRIITERSKYKDRPNYDIRSVIIKRGTDLRQEVLALQLMQEMLNIFVDEKLEIYLNCYKIYLINKNSALIEALNDVISIHGVKKRHRSLKEYYRQKFSQNYDQALSNFVNSLVGYSLATYFLQVKDRHNGNILLDDLGHLIHVDFGFILGSHPGFYNVERAPFKFSQEYIELLGDRMSHFKSMFVEGFMALRRNCDRLCKIIEILCDKGNKNYISKNVIAAFRERFKMELNDKDVEKWVTGLISWSLNSMGTGLYDSYQYFSQGYRK